MTKIALVLLVLCLLYLFVPRYNLYEKEDAWETRYLLREKGFWSQEACQRAGQQRENAFQCRSTNGWRGLWGKQVEYQ